MVCEALFSIAQVNRNWCGTKAPASFYTRYAQRDRSNYANYFNSRNGKRYVPVAYHVIVKNDGTGATSLKTIFASHCQLNLSYDTANIGFYIHSIDTIWDSNLWDLQDQNASDNAFSTYNISNVCNIYISGNLPGLCGFATLPYTAPRGGGVFMSGGCMGPGTKTLSHETGHFFGLLHTFDSFFGVEYVNGTNCSTAGDRFCDTPADFIDYRAPCPYTGDSTDPNGDLYKTVIDPSLLMSYFYDDCVYRFSPMQQAEMNTTLTNDLSALLNQQMPDLNPLDSAVLLAPVPGDNTFNSGIPIFRWRSVYRAQFYWLHVQSSNGVINYVDTVITDTVFQARNLLANKVYKFKVEPISFGNTCGDNANYNSFQTSVLKATVTTTPPSCVGENQGTIDVITSLGTGPYNYNWSNGATTSSLTNLGPGYYTATITDLHNNTLIVNVTLVDSPSIFVSVSRNGNNLTAYGNGGFTPYTYSWSNGVTGQANNGLAYGNYTVTVTDARGCSAELDVRYSGVNDMTETRVEMVAFPNPVIAQSELNVRLTINDKVDGVVSIMDLSGQVLQQTRKEFTPGINNLKLDIDKLSTGIYFVQFYCKGAVKTEKVSIIR